MDKENVTKLIEYWMATAAHDYETMLSLFKSKRYADSLFFGHIVLEKILKALVVRNLKDHAPKTHDLVRLAELADLDLDRAIVEYLKRVNRFNMRARYPDVKLKFYKRCDFDYTKENLEKIKELYKQLCQRLKQKK